MKNKRALTLDDKVHYVIFRELDKCGVPDPYNRASRICRALKTVVEYRAPPLTNPQGGDQDEGKR